ncbi:hypothetical protein NC651_031627 [Populus alba x Populus x berolinensis]|nr:hypothetical protein NC651_031627 [Populus alba x Populus x berolinensis]
MGYNPNMREYEPAYENATSLYSSEPEEIHIYDGYKSLKCVIAPSQVDSPTAAPSAGKFVTTAGV